MKKLIYLCFVGIFLFSCTSTQSNNNENNIELANNDELVYEFINFMIAELMTRHNVAEEDFCLSDLFHHMPYVPLFYNERWHYSKVDLLVEVLGLDSIYARKRIQEVREFRIDPTKIIANVNVIPEAFWEEVDFLDYAFENCDRDFFSISRPIFSKDKSLAYVSVERFHSSYIGLYEKQNGVWVLKDILLFMHLSRW